MEFKLTLLDVFSPSYDYYVCLILMLAVPVNILKHYVAYEIITKEKVMKRITHPSGVSLVLSMLFIVQRDASKSPGLISMPG